MSEDQELILNLQNKIKSLELDVQYELHLRTKLQEQLDNIKEKVKKEYNIEIE